MSDKWYQEHFFITPEARRSRIYLDTLNKREILGDCLAYLAYGYLRRFGATDGVFVSACILTADHFNAHPRVQPLFIRSQMLVRMLNTVTYRYGISSYEDLHRSEEAIQLYRLLEENEAAIKQFGYRDMPIDLYEDLVQANKIGIRQQDSLGIDGKKRQDLFVRPK